MEGYQITFFTQQSRRHGFLPMSEWLLQEAKKLGVPGVTVITATENFEHDGKLHSVHFFELADHPVEVLMALNKEDTVRLFQRLDEEDINIFYLKLPIEFGMTKISEY